MCMSVNCAGATLPEAVDDPETPAAKLRSYYDRVHASCRGDPVLKMRDIAAEAEHRVKAGEGAHPSPGSEFIMKLQRLCEPRCGGSCPVLLAVLSAEWMGHDRWMNVMLDAADRWWSSTRTPAVL